MKYFAKDIHGVQHGPLSEKDLTELVKQGLIFADSPVKKELIFGWNKAKDISFLQKEFFCDGSAFDGNVSEKEQKTALTTRLVPVHASLSLRVLASLYDFVFLAVVFLVLTGVGVFFAQNRLSSSDRDTSSISRVIRKREQSKKQNDPDSKKSKKNSRNSDQCRNFVKRNSDPTIVCDEIAGFRTGSLWINKKSGQQFICLSADEKDAVWCKIQSVGQLAACIIFVFFVFSMCWLGIPVAFRSQTGGMRFFGIFISDAEDPTTEVLELRAAAAYLLSLLTCWATPFCLLFQKQTIAEKITGTKIIRISAKRD